jgi:DNA-directed RNA polymerase specialized sigma24 family protein
MAVDGREDPGVESFCLFVAAAQRRLWLALCVEVGADGADDAVAEALAYGWAHWSRVGSMANPHGYLYRVAQRHARRSRRRRVVQLPRPEPGRLPEVEPGLIGALEALSANQRTVVFVIEGCGWTLAETAELLDVSVSTVRTHLARGLTSLRNALEVDIDV